MGFYESRSADKIEAVQYTPENRNEVIEFIRARLPKVKFDIHDFDRGDREVMEVTDMGRVALRKESLQVSDWIVLLNDDGKFIIYDDDAFQTLFQPKDAENEH